MITFRALDGSVSAFEKLSLGNNTKADESMVADNKCVISDGNDNSGGEGFLLDAELAERQTKRRETKKNRRKIQVCGNETFGLKRPKPREKHSSTLGAIQELNEQDDEAYSAADESESTSPSISDSEEFPFVHCATAVTVHVVRPVLVEIAASTHRTTRNSTLKNQDRPGGLARVEQGLEPKSSRKLGDDEDEEELVEEKAGIFDAIEAPITLFQINQAQESHPLLVTLAPRRQKNN